MGKVEWMNDIEPKNSSAGSGNKFYGNPNLFGLNKVDTQKTYDSSNLKTAKIQTKAAKTSKNIADLMKIAAVLFATTTTGIVGVGAISPTDLPKVEISEVYASENDISYFVSLDRYEEGLKIVLYNDFTNREQNFDGEAMEGTFEGLQVNMNYTFAIKKGTKVIAKQTVKTIKEKPYEEPNDPTTGDPTNENPNTSDGG